MFEITFFELETAPDETEDDDEEEKIDPKPLTSHSPEGTDLREVNVRKLFPLRQFPEDKIQIFRVDFPYQSSSEGGNKFGTLIIPAIIVPQIIEFAANDFRDFNLDLPNHQEYEEVDFHVSRGNPDNVNLFDPVADFNPHTHCLMCESNLEGTDKEYVRLEDPDAIYFFHPDCFVDFVNELQEVTLNNAGKYILKHL